MGALHRFSSTVLGSTWAQRTVRLVVVSSLLHCAFAAATGLSDTEAYYAQWARFPALSYYDHPPLIAWTTWLFMHLARAPAAVRAGPVLYAAVFDALLYRLTAVIFSPRAGFYAIAIVSALPVFFFVGFLLNPEALLAPLWVAFLLLLRDLRDHDEAWRPLAAGAIVGVAFLAKYTALLAFPVALLYVTTSARARRWIHRPSLYLSGLVAIPFASPVILWNALRGWPSLHLHLVERMRPSVGESLVESALRVERGQLFFFQPVLHPALIAVLGYTLAKAWRDERYRFLATASFPVLVFLFAMMIHVPDSEPHWTMVGYVPLLAAAGGLLDEGAGTLRRLSHVVFHGAVLLSVSGGIVYGVQLRSALGGGPLPSYNPSAALLGETSGWDRVASAVAAHVARLGAGAVVAGAHNTFCGHLQEALSDSPPVYCVSGQLTEYDFIGRRSPPPASPVVFVDSDRYPEDPKVVLPVYDCAGAEDLDIHTANLHLARYHLRDCIPRDSIPRAARAP
jgi:4-amino-4-deoxy-L-arabinose transferase-like glycosyltransferase